MYGSNVVIYKNRTLIILTVERLVIFDLVVTKKSFTILLPDDRKFIEALDEADALNAIKWAGARGRRRTLSLTV